MLLVGKDGTVKHRSGEPVDPEEIFSLVDAMPMRRREMREGGESRPWPEGEKPLPDS